MAAERSLTDRVQARLEEANHLGPVAATLAAVEEIEGDLADIGRRLEQLERCVLDRRPLPARATREALP